MIETKFFGMKWQRNGLCFSKKELKWNNGQNLVVKTVALEAPMALLNRQSKTLEK
jgi:hypothetical protein